MHATTIFTTVLALAAPLATALANPAEVVNADAVIAREAASGAVNHPRSLQRRTGGKCNGTSCQVKHWGFIKYNYGCTVGKCVGNGGGDGAPCSWEGSDTYCPNRG